MNRQQRRRAKAPDPGRHPRTNQRTHDLDSVELQQRLVSDAVLGYATPIEWAFAAYSRIARLDRITVDDAYLRVRQEVASLGAIMPDAPGS